MNIVKKDLRYSLPLLKKIGAIFKRIESGKKNDPTTSS